MSHFQMYSLSNNIGNNYLFRLKLMNGHLELKQNIELVSNSAFLRSGKAVREYFDLRMLSRFTFRGDHFYRKVTH